jgi:integrase
MPRRTPPPHAIIRPENASPHGVVFYEGVRKRRFLFFKTRVERDRELRRLTDAFVRGGTDLLAVSAAELAEFRVLRSAIGDTPIADVVALWRRHEAAARSALIVEAVDDYLLLRHSTTIEEGRTNAVCALKEFLAWLPASVRRVGDISGAGIQDFIDTVCARGVGRGSAALSARSPLTVRTRYKGVLAFLRWCLATGRVSALPPLRVELPPVIEGEVSVLSVEDCRRLFAVNADVDASLCALLALSAFGGLRTSSVLRLEASDLRRGVNAVLLPASKHKTARRHLATPLPENLWAWVERVPGFVFGEIGENDFSERRRAAARRAAVALPHNWGRHSFVTYYAALHGVAAAADIVGHRGGGVTWAHYKGNATREEGEAWFNIFPPAGEKRKEEQ